MIEGISVPPNWPPDFLLGFVTVFMLSYLLLVSLVSHAYEVSFAYN